MEPDVVRLYSSSPPPLDEVGEEEDEDEFGDFGGYGGGVSSSFSFSEFDTPTAFSQSYAVETSPPELHSASSRGVPQAGRTAVVEETGKQAEKHQAGLASNSRPSADEPAAAVDGENGKRETSELLSDVSRPDLQAAHSSPSNTGQHGQHRGSRRTVERGNRHGDRHSKLNRDADEEGHVESSSNGRDTGLTGHHSTGTKVAGNQSTEPGLACTTESCPDPHPPVSANIPQREASEPADAAAGERLTEAISDRRQCKDSAVGPAVEVPVVAPNTEPLGNSEEVSGAEVGPTVEVVQDLKAAAAVKEDEGGLVGPTVEADDDFGDFREVNQGFADFSLSDSATQEGFADFVTALSGCSTDEEFGDTDTLKDLKEEEELAEEEEEGVDGEGMRCSELPPSDSFADFSSAPCGGLASGVGESWAAFGQQGQCETQHEAWAAFGLQGESESHRESWAAFDEERQSSTATSPPSDSLRTDSVSDVLSCRLQHFFQSTFLSEVTPEVTEVMTLQVVLEPQDHGDNGSLPARGEPVALWHHLLDIHSAHGLKVQWVGSHSNRILLDSLGMRNILFTDSKRPVIVPIFASGLGMLKPTKDPVKPPSSSSAAARSAPGQDTSALCTPQVAPSSNASEDGVDPELYELTAAKLENYGTDNNRTDAFNRLMETIEKTSTLQRKPERDGEISEEATQVISALPDLSFMKARVLMFPSTLTPTANHL